MTMDERDRFSRNAAGDTEVSTKSLDKPSGYSRFDYDRYRHHLDRLDMPEAARRRVGEAVWLMMQNHVDRAWGDDPVQLVRGVGDRFEEAAEGDSLAVLGSERTQTD